MLMPKHSKKYRHICEDCGAEFFSASHNAMRCVPCRETARKSISKEWREKAKSKKPIISRVLPPRKSIRTVLRELERYNKEHGTSLSYGRYIALIEKGKY